MKSNDTNSSCLATASDFDILLGNKKAYTWEDFEQKLEEERVAGMLSYPESSLIALNLLTPMIRSLPYKSSRTDSETINDMLQDAWLIIREHIHDWDKSKQANFKTYITYWLQGLARETRGQGVSMYQAEELGIHIVSVDALVANGDEENPIEFVAEKASVEEIYAYKEHERDTKLRTCATKLSLDSIEDVDSEEAKAAIYQDVAYSRLLLGGASNYSTAMKDYMENHKDMRSYVESGYEPKV